MKELPGNIPINVWSAEPLSHDIRLALRRLSQADDVARIAVMPDIHLANDVCNGVALATRDLIYPQAVGGDIGCGMLAAAFDGDVQPLQDARWAEQILHAFSTAIPANKHGRDSAPMSLPDELNRVPLSDSRLDHQKHRDGRVQLGTLGRGNHFVELQADADERLWIMIHSGSRGMGQAITARHLAQAVRHGPGGLLALESRSEPGAAYLHDMHWAIRYAEENRLAMLAAAEKVIHDILGFSLDHQTAIHIHHNHVRRETHFEQELWVHRKGAMPADNDLPGVIPGSMGTASFHVTGRGCTESLRSCSHGAGRAVPRAQAFHSIHRREFLRQMEGVWFDESRTDMLRDEAPAAYKNVRQVLRAQRDLTRITRALRPVLVYKGA